MQRLFTQTEIAVYMDVIRDFTVAEFGEDYCSDLAHWQEFFAKGYHLRQVYGEFPANDQGGIPTVMGLATCILIPHSELEIMKRGEISDVGVRPWQPEDGKAVAWVGSVISEAGGIAAKCIAALIAQVEALPVHKEIDCLAVYCTGPQGYLMSEAFGLKPDGASYEEGWPFMERSIEPHELAQLGSALQKIWTMTMARDVVRHARHLWGHDWRHHVLEAREYSRGNR